MLAAKVLALGHYADVGALGPSLREATTYLARRDGEREIFEIGRILPLKYLKSLKSEIAVGLAVAFAVQICHLDFRI